MSKIIETLITPAKASNDADANSSVKTDLSTPLKGGASLFDTLLSDIQVPKKNDSKVEEKTTLANTKTEDTNSKELLKMGMQTYKNTANQNSNTSLVKEKLSPQVSESMPKTSSSSLMDSLLKEAKKEILEQKTETKELKTAQKELAQQAQKEDIPKVKTSVSKSVLEDTPKVENRDLSSKSNEKNISTEVSKTVQNTVVKTNNNPEVATPSVEKHEAKTTNSLEKVKEPAVEKNSSAIKLDSNNSKISNSKPSSNESAVSSTVEKAQSVQSDDKLISQAQSKLDELKVDKKEEKSLDPKIIKDEVKELKNRPQNEPSTPLSKLNNLAQDNDEVIIQKKESVQKVEKNEDEAHVKSVKQDERSVKELNSKNEPVKLAVDEEKAVQNNPIDPKHGDTKPTADTQGLAKDSKNLFAKVAQDESVVQKQTPNVDVDVKQTTTTVTADQPLNSEEPKPKSLLDKLVDDSLKRVNIKPENSEEKVQTPTKTVAQEVPNGVAQSVTATKEPLFANMYMSGQKHVKDLASMQQKLDGKAQAKNGTTAQDIQKSADTLGLNGSDMELKTQQVKTEQGFVNNDKVLNRMAFAKNILNEELNNIDDGMVKESKELRQTTHNNGVEKIKSVEINVAAPAVQTIQNRIIGAQQHMGQMMSDIARQMAQNYRPPVTAFRMNLNPNGLGHIAVMMKSDKENGLSISLNMSNSSTLDALVDNQSILRSALARNFETHAHFSLDFSMQNDAQSGSDSDSKQASSEDESNNGSSKNSELEANEIDDNNNQDYM
ncbi:MAG: flagellar hook-length control protein FliK [Campylobacterota bacterium]|nr:flagellar hook-length control protein FliK [Campylobacterota bacterium]